VKTYVNLLIAVAVGALLILVSYSATWAVVTASVFEGDSSVTSEVALSGRELAPLPAAMGWVALAAIAGIVATARWGRRVVGGILVLAGGIAGVTALTYALTDVASGGAGTFVVAALDSRGLGAPLTVTGSAWWILAIVGGLVTMAAGMMCAVAGHRLPALSRRYERNADTSATPGSVAMWDALDRGEDPTSRSTGSMGTEEER